MNKLVIYQTKNHILKGWVHLFKLISNKFFFLKKRKEKNKQSVIYMGMVETTFNSRLDNPQNMGFILVI